MNEYFATVEPLKSGGFKAILRTASDGAGKPILCKGGKTRIFPTELETQRAINEHLLRYVNGHYVREGAVAGAEEAAANERFTGPLKQRAKTRLIEVSYKQRGRR